MPGIADKGLDIFSSAAFVSKIRYWVFNTAHDVSLINRNGERPLTFER